jgi:hypothetical protein
MKNYIGTLSIGAFLASSVTAFAIPQSALMSFGVSVTASGGTTSVDTETSVWDTVPANIIQSAVANSPDAAAAPNIANAGGSAEWALDGDSGDILLSFGWNLTDAVNVNTNEANPDWSYTFVADQTGVFSMDYDISGAGDNLFGLNGYDITSDLIDPTGAPAESAFDPSSNGEFMGGVTAGETYTVSISNGGNFNSNSGVNDDATVNGSFDWQITPSTSTVPDGGPSMALVGGVIAGLLFVSRGSPSRLLRG